MFGGYRARPSDRDARRHALDGTVLASCRVDHDAEAESAGWNGVA
jgi:hypothetical protein